MGWPSPPTTGGQLAFAALVAIMLVAAITRLVLTQFRKGGGLRSIVTAVCGAGAVLGVLAVAVLYVASGISIGGD